MATQLFYIFQHILTKNVEILIFLEKFRHLPLAVGLDGWGRRKNDLKIALKWLNLVSYFEMSCRFELSVRRPQSVRCVRLIGRFRFSKTTPPRSRTREGNRIPQSTAKSKTTFCGVGPGCRRRNRFQLGLPTCLTATTQPKAKSLSQNL